MAVTKEEIVEHFRESEELRTWFAGLYDERRVSVPSAGESVASTEVETKESILEDLAEKICEVFDIDEQDFGLASDVYDELWGDVG